MVKPGYLSNQNATWLIHSCDGLTMEKSMGD